MAPTEYPEAPGAYVRVGGEWRALPRNTAVLPRSTARTLKTVSGWIGAATGKHIELPPDDAFERLGEVSLGNTGPVPIAPPVGVTIVYVGELGGVPSDYTARDAALAEVPLLAIGLLRADSAGARRTALYRLAPGILTIREGRLPGTFTRISDTVAKLTVSGRAPAGRYAITAGENLYEVEVAAESR